MYPTAQEQAVIAEAEQMMVETMARYDPSHDKYHGKVDLLVVELAALLHDVLDKKYVSAEQASNPYGFFLPFFEGVASRHQVDLISDGRGKLVAQVIDNRLREKGLWTEWHQTCLEPALEWQDADRLDAIGALVFVFCSYHHVKCSRCAAYSSVTNSPAIQHFHDKLIHIRDHLKTEAGKKWGTSDTKWYVE
ncbi:hypothetical protein BKA70DRAFT_1369958 [Coprinopsis sp. MPI-PUGE-AT-0042]|nr:hypothetical protein BKA70DRAFT_1369958 [Coprinopsis sp. MPI-PUGE-AT-0042]